MTYASVRTTIEVDLEEFDTDDLIDELKSRGVASEEPDEDSVHAIVTSLYNSLRSKNEFDTQWAQSQLIDKVLGKII
jgi:hypothetical protein